MGRARLLNRIGVTQLRVGDLEEALALSPQRLLIRTLKDRNHDRFPCDYGYFSAEAAREVVAAGVRLVGLDSPSVDHPESAELPAHKILGEAGVVILENLELGQVPEGDYELIALPLKIVGGDGSPVRAVLLSVE
jgi:arylformamidase